MESRSGAHPEARAARCSGDPGWHPVCFFPSAAPSRAGRNSFKEASTMVWNVFTRTAGNEPWRELSEIHSQMNRILSQFHDAGTQEFPPIELWSGENGILMHARLPGAKAEDIEISVVGETVTLKGDRRGSGTNAG